MSVQLFPWWGWILVGVGLWFIQLILSAFADGDLAENKHTLFFRSVRVVVIIGTVLTTLIGIVRFVKWVWNG